MQLNLRLALISALALLPRISHATDGEINITGTIVANTCDITSGTGGKHAVVLPTVSANALTAAGTPSGAGNVQVGLSNADFSQIALNQPQAAQNSQWVDITGGAATLTYFAEYYSALGGVTAGAVKADTFFTLTYQ